MVFLYLISGGTIMSKRKSVKRENGTGSVYKRRDLKRRPWAAVVTMECGFDLESKKYNFKRIILGYFETAQEAKDALEDFRKNPTTKINITLEDLFNEWKNIAYKNISKQTADNYNACWLKLISIHKTKFREIRTSQMQSIIDDLNMSHSTLSKIKALLSQLFDYAMQNDIVNKNYAKFIVLPKQTKTKKDCFTDLELKKIEQAVDVVPYADVILAMCYTGFRISEFLELTKFNYNGKENYLQGGKKTSAGTNRIVPVHHKIKHIIEKWLSKSGETIFCKEDGSAMSPDYFRKYKYKKALKEIGVRQLTPHATRHTFATRLAQAGVRTEDIQTLAGHEDYAMTANTYIHQNIRTLTNAIECLK